MDYTIDPEQRLITISGIGPKLALAVLSGIEPRELAGAIQRNDIARLTAIPGVGKKTAERICVELRDRIPKAIEAAAASPAGPSSTSMTSSPLSARSTPPKAAVTSSAARST